MFTNYSIDHVKWQRTYQESNANSKRQPCPQCQSKTAFSGIKCHKCGYIPDKGLFSDVSPTPKISQPLCDCGNVLNTTAQRKANKCGFCLQNEAKALALVKAKAKPITTKPKIKGLVFCDCGNALSTTSELRLDKCYHCQYDFSSFETTKTPHDQFFNDLYNMVFCDCGNQTISGQKCYYCQHVVTVCDCGNDLNTPNQIKLQKCYGCQVKGAYQFGDATAKGLGGFTYSQKKRLDPSLLQSIGARVITLHGRFQHLCYPQIDENNAIGYQIIDPHGAKKFGYPVHQQGSFFRSFIGDPHGELIACEGMATGISIKMALPNANILVCGNADNLIKAAKQYGNRVKYIATDNDKSHAGINKATIAAKICGAKIWYCPIDSDFNDLYCQMGLEAVTASFQNDTFQAASLHLLATKHGAAYIQTNNPLDEVPIFEGVTVLSAAMGSGKSRHYFPRVRDMGKSCLAIAHLKSLVKGLAKVLEAHNYEDTDLLPDRLACCINSIMKYLRLYDVFLIDEFHAALDFLAFGKTANDAERIKIYNTFKAILSTAKYICFASATMSPQHAETVINMAKEIGKPITIIEHVVKPSKKVILRNISDFTELRNEALDNKRNVFSFSLSKDNIIALENEVKEKGITAISVHAGDKGKNMDVVTNGDYVNYQHFGGSPSILAGTHFVGHFDDVFIDQSSKTEISPLAAIQALGRVRTAQTIQVCLNDNKGILSESAFVSAETILLAKRKSLVDRLRAFYAQESLSPEFVQSQIDALQNQPFTDYDYFSANLKKSNDDMFTDWNNEFLHYAHELGYEIEDKRTEKTEADKATRKERSQAVKVVRAERYHDIANTNLIEYDIKALRYKMDKTEAEQHAIIKHDCLMTFQEADYETIYKVMENGLHTKAFNFALVNSEFFTNERLLSITNSIILQENSTANLKIVQAKREVLLALLAVVNVQVTTRGYDFSQTVPITTQTDFTAIDELIKANRYALGLGRYTKLGHVAALRLLREWLGFEVSAKKQNDNSYIWQVKGLSDGLVTIGGRNKLKELDNNMVVYCEGQIMARFLSMCITENSSFRVTHDSLNTPITRKEEFSVTPTVNTTLPTSVITENSSFCVTHDSLNIPITRKEEFIVTPIIHGCQHDWHWSWHNDTPKCDTCHATWEQWPEHNQKRLLEPYPGLVIRG